MEEQNKDCICKEPISAFAFNTAKSLEDFINNYNGGLITEFQLLQAKILDFYSKNKEADDFDAGPRLMREFQATFGIQTATEGHVQNN